MKNLLLIILLLAGSSVTACGYENINCGDIVSAEISGCENSGAETDCCDDFCPCYCCTSIPGKVEISKVNLLPATSERISFSKFEFHASHIQKHWQPPKL